MRELAREIARNAVQSNPGNTPTVSALYFFFLRCLNNNEQAAEDAMTEYLQGRVPEPIRQCVQNALGGVATISE
jgi:hypothetical protein